MINLNKMQYKIGLKLYIQQNELSKKICRLHLELIKLTKMQRYFVLERQGAEGLVSDPL